MRQSTRWLIGCLGAGVLAGMVISGGARAQDGPARMLKIAVLNMGDCTEAAKNDHAKEMSVKFDTLGKEAKDELQRIRKKADELRNQAKALEEGSPLQMQLATQYNLEEAKHKIVSEMSQRQLIAARDAFKNQLYSEARKMADVVAREMKIDLVLRSDEGAFEEDKSDMVMQKNMLRSVLFYDPSLDITAKVLARLNEDYAKTKKNSSYECPKCKVVSKEPKCPRCGDALKN